jgi:lipopolysaccharide/colanic/teichoic acid biosynthesis glycosyltransferase
VYQSCSLGGPDGDAYLCAPLGRIGKNAFDITLANIALFVLAPVLLATADLIRMLMHNSVFVTDECIEGSGYKRWRPLQGVSAASA